MWDFLERMTFIALPRIRDFRGVRPLVRRPRQLLARPAGAAVFPEIEYDKIDKVRGMAMTIVTTAPTDEESTRVAGPVGHAVRSRRSRGGKMAKKMRIKSRVGRPQFKMQADTGATSVAARGLHAQVRLCRICFRERALQGDLPGVIKSSW